MRVLVSALLLHSVSVGAEQTSTGRLAPVYRLFLNWYWLKTIVVQFDKIE